MSNILLRRYPKSGYFILFDREKGCFVRIGNNGNNPFCNYNGPELLDISITNYCERGCDFCYRLSNKNGYFMNFADYESILWQAEELGVLQIALGGGNPNQHPDFIKILEKTKIHNIVPSYTTNGQGMTDEIYSATKKFCGAMAVSWYPPYYDAVKVVENCEIHEIKCNIHFLLDSHSINDAILFLRNEVELLKRINAIVFLNYKPIHGGIEKCLADDEALKSFIYEVENFSACKIGFDSCMISYLTLMNNCLVDSTIEYCEAGRFSAFISENLILYPCSFMNDLAIAGVDLTKASIMQGWKYGEAFIEIRERLQKPGAQKYPIELCKSCSDFKICAGGCPILPINRCI